MKNIILITFLFFIYSCGYTSVYKNLESSDYLIAIKDLKGDTKMNNLIKNQIDLYSNKNSANIINIDINSQYKKVVLTKNSLGKISDYQLSAKSTFTIYIGDETIKKTFNETLNVKNQTDIFEQNLYENNVKRNFAASLRDKLILEILSLK